MSSNTCPQTGKFQYESRSVAESVLRHKKERKKVRRNKSNRSSLKEIGVYKCEFCHYYHLHGASKI